MMTVENTADAHFYDLLVELRNKCEESDFLAKLRQASWNHFEALGLPSTRDEIFRYVGLRKLFQQRYCASYLSPLSREAIAPYILPECQQAVAVFVNGHFDPSLSSFHSLPQLGAAPLAEAFKSYGSFLNNQWLSSLEKESDAWHCLNGALHPAGLFLYVPPRVHLKTPLQLLFIVDAQEQPMLLLPRWHLYLGSQASAEIALCHLTLSGEKYAQFPAAELSLDDGAALTIVELSSSERQSGCCGASFRATMKRNSFLDTTLLVQGGALTRHDYRVKLQGEGAKAQLNGLALLDGNEAHIYAYVDHIAPACDSLQLFKNVLRTTSRSSFEGKIFVHSEAQKTNAFQLNNNLPLSDNTQSYSKPNLEIKADDVKASHGATVGQLDREQLFYLRTRGLSRQAAQSTLIQGFCRSILDKISLPALHGKVQQTIVDYAKKE